jgi:isopentenyl phosphate kinase
MEGLAKTRLSVQTLNQLLVSSLVTHGVNAVAISPCFAIPNMQAHGGDQVTNHGLVTVIRDALQAGLVPVLHGDACLYGRQSAGILSGDILVEKLGQRNFFSQVVFLTDVDGVFSRDPRDDPTAMLLRYIQVDKNTLDIILGGPELSVTGSSHDHDVTGGLKVSKRLGSIRPCCFTITPNHSLVVYSFITHSLRDVSIAIAAQDKACFSSSYCSNWEERHDCQMRYSSSGTNPIGRK